MIKNLASLEIFHLLGDSHNGGKRVLLSSDGRIYKPRCIFWEWLFLGVDSPFRHALKEFCFYSEYSENNFLLPNLLFSIVNEIPQYGYVERLEYQKANKYTLAEFEAIGATVALLGWFGLSDLHKENVALGRDVNGKLIFCPIDIEILFHDFSLISQTCLFPTSVDKKNICGLTQLIRFAREAGSSKFAVAMCHGYLEAMIHLNKNGYILDRSIEVASLFRTGNGSVISDALRF
ncbi:MAG: hypothetical protein A3C46_09735 [Deltaproteobacteria bacterium RIFCSPHIGHO2_02_FULL_44_16]|nr:MAG: hypothetical protein A3C46_09735 [Deltaproteobacteria bacterium RIFCSPHIGHO2_02_FULL_44_16]